MANPKQLALLKKGVKGWNAWRLKNPSVEPDLSEANLRGAKLANADLSWVDLCA